MINFTVIRIIGIILFNVAQTHTLTWPQTIKECLNETHSSQEFQQRSFYKEISKVTLPEPLENGSAYYLLETMSPVSWCEGYHVCQTGGYTLATIESSLIQDTMREEFTAAPVKKLPRFAWLSARRKDFGSDWSWTVPGLPDLNETFDNSNLDYGDFGSVLVLQESLNDFGLYNDKRSGGTENIICSPSGKQHENQTWFQAQTICSLSGERLVTLAELVNLQPVGKYIGRYWLGLARNPWIWLTGDDSYDPVLYNEWANHEMNVTDECLWFSLYDGLWQPSPCDATTNYIICEGKDYAAHAADHTTEDTTDRGSVTTVYDPRTEIETDEKQGPTYHQNLLYGAYALGSFIILLLVIFLAVFFYRRRGPQPSSSNGDTEAGKPTVRPKPPSGGGKAESSPAGPEDITSTYLTTAEGDAEGAADYYNDIDLYQSIRDSDIYSDGQQIPTLEQREKMNKQRFLKNEVKTKDTQDTMMYTNADMEQPSTSQPDASKMRELEDNVKLLHKNLPHIQKMNELGFHEKLMNKEKIGETQDAMMYTNVETEQPSTSQPDSGRMRELETEPELERKKIVHIQKMNNPTFDSEIENEEPTVHFLCNKSLSSEYSSLDEKSRVPYQKSSYTHVSDWMSYDDVRPPGATTQSTDI